jgi:hypothetical protein
MCQWLAHRSAGTSSSRGSWDQQLQGSVRQKKIQPMMHAPQQQSQPAADVQLLMLKCFMLFSAQCTGLCRSSTSNPTGIGAVR